MPIAGLDDLVLISQFQDALERIKTIKKRVRCHRQQDTSRQRQDQGQPTSQSQKRLARIIHE